jgi:hypothetical protein
MAHRGRLNVLANIMNKTYEDIFNEFEGKEYDGNGDFSGDVKYHLGYSTKVKTRQEHEVKLTLSPNPSHLEAVGPVVQGITRAFADVEHDNDYKKMPLSKLRTIVMQKGLSQESSKLKKNEWMAQEYFNYKYDEYTCALIKIEKFISTIILKRKLNGGLTYYAELIKNNEIQNTIESIARKIDLTGCINIQLKIYKNRISIFEINPRISSSVMIRHKLGFTDCLWWVEYFLNKKIPTPKKIINKSVYKFYTEKFIN